MMTNLINKEIEDLISSTTFNDEKREIIPATQILKDLNQHLNEKDDCRKEHKEEDRYQDTLDFLAQNYLITPAKCLIEALNQLITKKNFKVDTFWEQIKHIAKKIRGVDHDLLSKVPEDWKQKNQGELCNIITTSNPNNIRFVPKEIVKIKDNLEKIYLPIISEDPLHLLRYLPHDLENYEKICIKILTSREFEVYAVLKWVPETSRSFQVCSTIIKHNPDSIQHLPMKFIDQPERYNRFCLSAVASKGSSLRHILVDKLSTKQYIALCKKAIEKEPSSISFASIKDTNEEKLLPIFLNTLEQNPLLIQSLHNESKIKYEDKLGNIYQKALSKKPFLLKTMPFSTQKKHPEIVFDALKKDFALIQYVDNQVKERLFNDDEMMKQMNIRKPGIIQYIPKEKLSSEIKEGALIANFSDKKYLNQDEIETLTDTITTTEKNITILVVKDNHQDAEIDLSRNIYAIKHTHRKNTQKKDEHTLSVEKKDLSELLKNVKKNNLDKPIKLVILGHGTKEMDNFCGFTPQDIKECIENKEHPTVSKIVLLGCHTVSAKATKEEQNHIKNFLEKLNNEEAEIEKIKIDANTPTEKNIKTSNSDDLNKQSFLSKVYTKITTELPNITIELKGATRPLFPDPILEKFHGANTNIKRKEEDAELLFEIDPEKRKNDMTNRMKSQLKNLQQENSETLNTEGKYFSIKTGMNPKK